MGGLVLGSAGFVSSVTAVAAALGYRGHSSVHYAMGRIENPDRALAELLAAIEQELTY